jgi:hypothetical protein
MRNGKPLFPVACPSCGTVMLWSSYVAHMRNVHGRFGTMLPSLSELEKIRFHGEYVQTTGRRPGFKPKKKSKGLQVKATAPKQPPKPKPIDSAALTEAVLDALFPKGVPVSKLRLVAQWVEATDTFVKEAGL